MTDLPATIRQTEVRLLPSATVGDVFKLSIAYPTKDGDQPYPVLYVLDANICFGLVTDTVRLMQFGQELPDMIIVGIGYPDDSQHLSLRSRDLTPTLDDVYTQDWLNKVSVAAAVPSSGGVEKFLAFLCQELRPYLQDRLHINADDATLAGVSYGGLFALYTLFHQPAAFRRYIIGSPSIWWDNKITLSYEAAYAANHNDLAARVFMSVGALEVFEPEPAAMVSNMQEMAMLLRSRQYPRLELVSHIFEGETHLSVIPATISRGLRAVFNTKAER